MSASLRILRAGIYSTVQDLGRTGSRAWGVPVSGALDPIALKLANAVAGNCGGSAALEMLYSGLTLQCIGGAVRIAIGCAEGTIDAPSRPSVVLQSWRSALLRPGATLRIAAPTATAAAYLAVEGGFAVPAVLGSASTYVPAAIGGFAGRPLRAGDVLPVALDEATVRAERFSGEPPSFAAPDVLRVIPGPQAQAFARGALEALEGGTYRVTPSSNRAGLRLEGPPLAHAAGHDLLSEGVATGSIQVPGSQQPVVLIADHPTVGGYPKIATVISADWPAAGRLRIGAAVRFRAVDADEARAARADAARSLAEHLAAIGEGGT